MNDPRQATRDRTGQTLGPYRVIRLLGAGGMGRVYLAEDTVANRQVALKVLNDDVVRDWAARLRFLREAQAASAVLHPSVAAVYAIHEADDSVFIAMEFVEGRTLRNFLESRRGPLDLREALRIARDVAHALCHAHAAGVVHRDLKPENLMLDLQGQVKILDFGLAKHAGPGQSGDVQHASTLSFATADGVILGTPSYMAPEQIHGKATDARADIFSVGVVLYEMATGARPFRGASTMEVLIATARDELTPASQHNPQVPPTLDTVLARCLAKAPDDRFPDAVSLAAALDDLLLAEVEVELHGTLRGPIQGRGYLGEILPPRLLRGRDLESSALLAAVNRAAEGGAHLVLIHGDAGVGKSALLSSLRDPITRMGSHADTRKATRHELPLAEEPDTSITLSDVPGPSLADPPAVTRIDLPAISTTPPPGSLATPPPGSSATPPPGSLATPPRGSRPPPDAPPPPLPRNVTRFISGKFDRNSEGAPLAPLAQALGALVRQAAASDMASRWRSDLSEATGPNRHVLDDMVPELRRLLGESSPEAHAAAYHPDHGAEARNRFHATFQRVVRLFAARHPPLVLALDDLHLADPAALELLEILLSDPAGGQLLVLATYRDGELGDAHPLVLTLDRLRRIGVPVDELALDPLLPEEATQLVADALGCSASEAAPLAERLASHLAPRARGNPAILRHLLLGLRRENQLRFDTAAGRWQWDESETSAAIISGDVATLIAARLQRLSPGVQRLLAIAALAGRPVDLALLSAVDRRGPLATTEDLRDALREGLLVPSDAALHSLQRNPDPADPAEAERRTYQPPHDGILQAARLLLTPDERAEIHLQLGRSLLSHHRPGDDDLFAIVDHLDRGASLIHDPDEHERLARLHLEASRRARNATAYAAAVRHARAGLDALAAALIHTPGHDRDATVRPGAVQRRYPAHVFQLEREWMHAEAMRGELASADERFDPLVASASSELERAELYRLKAQLDTYHGRPHEAMAAGLAGLYRLGVELLPRPEPAEIEAEFIALQASLAELGPGGWAELDVLATLPPCDDPQHTAIAELLAVVGPAAMFADTRLAYQTFLRQVARSLAHGPTRNTAYGLAGLGLYLAGARRDSAAAFHCGQLALHMLERPTHGHDAIQAARILHIVGGLITGWTQPFAVAAATLEQGYEIGVRTGDFAAATYNTTTLVLVLVARRHSLDAVRSIAEQRLIEARPMLEVYGSSILRAAIRMCRCLAGDLVGPDTGPITHWLADVFERDLERDLSPLTLMYLHIYELAVLYHFDRHTDLPVLPAPAAERLGALLTPMAVDYYFFHALHRCAALTPGSPPERHTEIAADLAQLRSLADTCPANFSARALLVAAAHDMARGRDDDAESGFKKAIRAARLHAEAGTEAIACELAGQHSLKLGDDIVGTMYLRAAVDAYHRFGAHAIATRLTARIA